MELCFLLPPSPSPQCTLKQTYPGIKDNVLGQRLHFCLSGRGWIERLDSRGVSMIDSAPSPDLALAIGVRPNVCVDS